MPDTNVQQSESLVHDGIRRQRVVFCTYSSVYSDIVLDELLRSEEIDVVGVVMSTRVLRKNYNHFLASVRQIQQSGFRYAFYLFAVTGIYSALRLVFRKLALGQRLVKLGVPTLKTQDINNEDGLSFLEKVQPDILLSAHFNQLVKASVLDMVNLTCLNVHPSLLPAYKGVDPAFYAILRKEESTGVTVHRQDEGFDTGEILQRQSLQIRWHDSLLSLNMKLFKLGAISAVKEITEMAKGNAVTSDKVQTEAGHYDSWPNPYDAHRFREQRQFFRWKELIRFVRRST